MIALTEVTKRFGAVTAVEALTLKIKRGEIFGLLGPNGAGKSTTIAMAVGLLKPDSGRVDLAGKGPPTDPEARRCVGLAPQALALYDELTATENLGLLASLYGMSRAEAVRRASELLNLVGLSERASARAKTYSGGMKRRLNLAAAMVHDPDVLLLDEPTAGVDPQSRHSILELIRGLRDRGKTVVYTTHYMEEAQRVCDRVAIMDHGRVLALGTVDALLREHGGKMTVHATNGAGERRVETDDPIAEIRSLLESGGATELRVERPNLESVFLGLTGRRLRD
ncbi:MAG: ABC transporter ATP-binding protein [Phycisphaeraceae bacterium]|nr:ABC transporter ATP-binding protein [Phycisphaeraceae bacterium]